MAGFGGDLPKGALSKNGGFVPNTAPAVLSRKWEVGLGVLDGRGVPRDRRKLQDATASGDAEGVHPRSELGRGGRIVSAKIAQCPPDRCQRPKSFAFELEWHPWVRLSEDCVFGMVHRTLRAHSLRSAGQISLHTSDRTDHPVQVQKMQISACGFEIGLQVQRRPSVQTATVTNMPCDQLCLDFLD